MKRILRVFPRRTNATPVDSLVRVNEPPGLFERDMGIDEVHVSVTFSDDVERSEILRDMWETVAPVSVGGPARGDRGKQFETGLYLRDGYVITSRGCPNDCWFCDVPKREGQRVRTLGIRDGWNVLDDNLLACPDDHVRAVFEMLGRQPH